MEELFGEKFVELVEKDPHFALNVIITTIYGMISLTDKEKEKCDNTCKYFNEGGPCINCRRNHQYDEDRYEAKE